MKNAHDKGERRQQRSEDPTAASALYLTHLAERLGCEAIALSAQDGELLGGVGDGYDLGLLSTLASLGSQIGHYEPEAEHAARGPALRFYGVELGERRYYLSSVGGEPLPIDECAAAIQRIHTKRAA